MFRIYHELTLLLEIEIISDSVLLTETTLLGSNSLLIKEKKQKQEIDEKQIS